MRPETTLAPIRSGQPYHVVVTYRNGFLACYVDGTLATESREVRGDFSNWAPMHLILGDEYRDSRDWQGALERIAIYSRFLGPKEARQRYQLWKEDPE